MNRSVFNCVQSLLSPVATGGFSGPSPQ